jgi:hypothetical protein
MRPIEIERTKETGERTWRAVVLIPKGIPIATGAGISGAMTEPGPWTEGYGYSPEGALQAAYAAIGRAVTSLHPVMPESSLDTIPQAAEYAPP